MFCCGLIMSLVIVNTLPKIKKKNAEFRRRRAPPSPVWVSKLAVQGREQDVQGAIGKKSGTPQQRSPIKVSLDKEQTTGVKQTQSHSSGHQEEPQTQVPVLSVTCKQATRPLWASMQRGKKPCSSLLLKVVIKRERQGEDETRRRLLLKFKEATRARTANSKRF